MKVTRQHLERLYRKYNRREYVSPDPLQLLYEYDDPADREVVGLVASSLAYGRVVQILRSARTVLERMGEPAKFITESTPAKLRRTFSDFKHRFTTGEEMAALLAGAARAIKKHGSLGGCFASHCKKGDETVLPAMAEFASEIGSGTSLVSRPAKARTGVATTR